MEFYVGLGGDLAGYDDEARRHQAFHCHAAVGVLPAHFVKHRIADLVGDLVGMPLRHRLRCEKSASHGMRTHRRARCARASSQS